MKKIEHIDGTKLIDKELISLDIFETRIQLCNDETKKYYLTKIKDPFLNRPFVDESKKVFQPQYKKKHKKKSHFDQSNSIKFSL